MTEKNSDSPVSQAAQNGEPDSLANPSLIAADGARTSGDGGESSMEIPEIQTGVSGRAAPSCDQALDMLGDVELDVKVELGRCQMLVGDVLGLQEGDVVELDKLAGDPVDVFVNDRLVARGEVLVVNENFCVRVNQIVAKED